MRTIRSSILVPVIFGALLAGCGGPQAPAPTPAPVLNADTQALATQRKQIRDLRYDSAFEVVQNKCGYIRPFLQRSNSSSSLNEIRRELDQATQFAQQLPGRARCVQDNIAWSIAETERRVEQSNVLLRETQDTLDQYPGAIGSEDYAYFETAEAYVINPDTLDRRRENQANSIIDHLSKAESRANDALRQAQRTLSEKTNRRDWLAEGLAAGINSANGNLERSMRQINNRNAQITGMPPMLTPTQQREIQANIAQIAENEARARRNAPADNRGLGPLLTATYSCFHEASGETLGSSVTDRAECEERYAERDEQMAARAAYDRDNAARNARSAAATAQRNAETEAMIAANRARCQANPNSCATIGQ